MTVFKLLFSYCILFFFFNDLLVNYVIICNFFKRVFIHIHIFILKLAKANEQSYFVIL